ncbi:MAG: aminotransferase class V-fold PLP-dependent enzyme [Actinobacteria bacterium]|nr:aminotransferase class V-fold PLP-dependent enzyme [Actinomycetota bacterium]
MADPEQSTTPYVDALLAYSALDPGRFQVPGHKGGLGADPAMRELVGDVGLRNDVPSVTEGVDIGPEPTPFQQAQLLAAGAWGARRSWFLINGASQGNHATMMALAHMGSELVVQRNVHSSVIDGLVLSGMRPTFVAPEIDPELGIAHGLTPASLEAALAATPNAVAALVVSPTYFGACADVAALAEVAHGRGLPLVVDEAWGAHMHFHPDLPQDALAAGADLVTSSTHKIVGALTQAAMLHLGHGDRIDDAVVDRCVSLVETTSPSGLLSGSLDAARRMAAVHGEALLTETLAAIGETRTAIREIPGLDVLDERMIGRPGIAAWDPLRLAVDVRGTGSDGYRLAKAAFYDAGIDLELYTTNVVVAIFGMAEPRAQAERLVAGLREAVAHLEASPGSPDEKLMPPPPWGELVLTPREAYLGPQEVVEFDAAAGRIAAEGLAAYPPGIPNVLPGERLSAETLEYIHESVAHGGYVRGGSDRALRTLRVTRA